MLACFKSKFCHFAHVCNFSLHFCNNLCDFRPDRRRGQSRARWFTENRWTCTRAGFRYASQANLRGRSLSLRRTIASSLLGKVSTSESLSGKSWAHRERRAYSTSTGCWDHIGDLIGGRASDAAIHLRSDFRRDRELVLRHRSAVWALRVKVGLHLTLALHVNGTRGSWTRSPFHWARSSSPR